jgi:hypothetical protein
MAQFFKLASAAIVAFAIGSGFPAAAAPATTAPECVADGNVWVHVEYDDIYTGACATQFATAQLAMESAGLLTDEGPFYNTIDGRAADLDAREWWSLWSMSPDADGTYSDWEFATVGAHEYALEGGDVVSWTLQPDWNLEATAPSVDPLADEAPATEPPASPEPAETPSATVAPTTGPSAPAPTPTPGGTSAPGLPSTGV